MSPLLFNLVGDALADVLKKARGEGFVQGLVPDLVEGGLICSMQMTLSFS